MTEIDYTRQEGIYNPGRRPYTVAVIGCGSVGSFTALAMAKMGLKVKALYDSDAIEPHNLPNQFFKLSQVGEDKVDALASLLKVFTGQEPEVFKAVNDDTFLHANIVVSAVDSMKARHLIWKRVLDSSTSFYIDSRMGGKVFSVRTVNCFNEDARKQYESSLVGDGETRDLQCTERSIVFNVLGLASFVCNQIVKVANDEAYSREVHFDYGDYSLVAVK